MSLQKTLLGISGATKCYLKMEYVSYCISEVGNCFTLYTISVIITSKPGIAETTRNLGSQTLEDNNEEKVPGSWICNLCYSRQRKLFYATIGCSLVRIANVCRFHPLGGITVHRQGDTAERIVKIGKGEGSVVSQRERSILVAIHDHAQFHADSSALENQVRVVRLTRCCARGCRARFILRREYVLNIQKAARDSFAVALGPFPSSVPSSTLRLTVRVFSLQLLRRKCIIDRSFQWRRETRERASSFSVWKWQLSLASDRDFNHSHY